MHLLSARMFYSRIDDEYVLHLADGFELDVQSAVHAANDLADAVQKPSKAQRATDPWLGP